MPKRLTERYDIAAIRFTRAAPHDAMNRDLIGVVDAIFPEGSVFHVLRDTPDDSGDELSILIDGDRIVHFELPCINHRDPRLVGGPPSEVQIESLEEFRKRIGQGRFRILVDHAVEDARGQKG